MPRCARCSGFGHEESACPSDATVLVMELPDDDSEEEKVFTANATGKCSWRIGEEVGDGELDKQVAQYIADSGATCHLAPDADDLTNYREFSRPLGLAHRRKISIAGYDDLTVAFRSNDSWVHIKLHNVVHASLFFSSFFFHLTYSRWTSSFPSCLWSQRIFPSLPGSRLTIFLSRCKFSTLTTRQPMVEFYLLTFPRFPLRKKEHKSYFGKNRTHDFRTSRCAAYLLDHSGDER